ncbi:hypothetical protein RJ639_023190 [Escallonia herrerae]|uniref:Transposase (putative) gypsy type domain-containing protein n=1 Tax=Escallonia herrerae TaxID=1293975 RepID=A0AA88UYU8_9ASTE|nr:hypothetical protein RJ639_023190 [Escallonia herrerae]
MKDQAEDKANPKPWYTADEKSSKMSEEDLQELIQEYPLPEGWYARLPGLQEPANYRTKFEIGIYEEQVKSGYRLPLHPFALHFFEHYHMASGQLVPNGWRKVVGLIYLVQTLGYKPDATDFMRVFFKIYFVKGVANCPGWYYIHSRQRASEGRLKSNKGWHSRYFFVGRLDKGRLPFEGDWNPYCKDFENPGKPIPNNLTKHILSHIKLQGVEVENPYKEAFLAFFRKLRGSEKRSNQVWSCPLLLRGLESLFHNVFHASWSKCPLMIIPSFDRDGQLGVMTLGCQTARSWSSIFFMEFFLETRKSSRIRHTRLLPSPSPRPSEMLSRFEMARQIAAEEAYQEREAVKEAQEATHRAEELSKQEVDHLAQILTLEKRLERAKRRVAEEVTKARDQGIRDFLDGNAGDEWLKKRTEDGLEIYELGFVKAEEMFTERFPDIPLDDFVLPAVISPSGETVLPSEAGDAAAFHPPGEGPSGDAPEP